MSIVATYVSSSSFKVAGDRTGEFRTDRRVKADLRNDGSEYLTIVSSSYSAPWTTVTVKETTITSNLTNVLYGAVASGEGGALPLHTHLNDDQGGRNAHLHSRRFSLFIGG